MCAALGVVIAFVIVLAMDLPEFILPVYPPSKEIIVGLVALFIAAAWLGTKAGWYLCRKEHDRALNVVVGLGVAFGSIAVAVMTGTLLGVVSEADEIFGSTAITPAGVLLGMFFPLLIVLLFGGIPAAFLGVLYGFVVRNCLRKLNR